MAVRRRKTRRNPRRQSSAARAASLRNLRKARAALRHNPSRRRSRVRRNPKRAKAYKGTTRLTGLSKGDRVVVYRHGKSVIQHNVGGVRPRDNPHKSRKRKHARKNPRVAFRTADGRHVSFTARHNPSHKRRHVRRNPRRMPHRSARTGRFVRS